MQQIRQPNSGRCPMSEAGWAERKVERKLGGQYISLSPKLTAELLLAEHRRAVRVVKQEIEAVKNDQRTYRSEERCLILGSLETVLKALQRGRE